MADKDGKTKKGFPDLSEAPPLAEKRGGKKAGAPKMNGAAKMVAPKPMASKETGPGLKSVEDLAKDAGLKPWALAGLMRFCRWAAGKQVSAGAFNAALKRFETRRMCGGTI